VYSPKMNRSPALIPIFFLVLAVVFMITPSFAADGSHHKHHVAVAGGLARNNDQSSGYLGVDYVYRFSGPWAAGVFYEEVSGDFDIRAWGLTFGRYFDSGWKIGAGPGAEYKFKKNKTLALFHVSGGYDWHMGNWSIGPVATLDFIEGGEQTYYLGMSIGYGF